MFDFDYFQAAQHGATECVHWLLEHRAGPNIRDGKYSTWWYTAWLAI